MSPLDLLHIGPLKKTKHMKLGALGAHLFFGFLFKFLGAVMEVAAEGLGAPHFAAAGDTSPCGSFLPMPCTIGPSARGILKSMLTAEMLF